MQFHITKNIPTRPWPNGSWSVYRIDCDEIASRIKFGPDGQVIERYPWPGYVGLFETLGEATVAILDLTDPPATIPA